MLQQRDEVPTFGKIIGAFIRTKSVQYPGPLSCPGRYLTVLIKPKLHCIPYHVYTTIFQPFLKPLISFQSLLISVI